MLTTENARMTASASKQLVDTDVRTAMALEEPVGSPSNGGELLASASSSAPSCLDAGHKARCIAVWSVTTWRLQL